MSILRSAKKKKIERGRVEKRQTGRQRWRESVWKNEIGLEIKIKKLKKFVGAIITMESRLVGIKT